MQIGMENWVEPTRPAVDAAFCTLNALQYNVHKWNLDIRIRHERRAPSPMMYIVQCMAMTTVNIQTSTNDCDKKNKNKKMCNYCDATLVCGDAIEKKTTQKINATTTIKFNYNV